MTARARDRQGAAHPYAFDRAVGAVVLIVSLAIWISTFSAKQ